MTHHKIRPGHLAVSGALKLMQFFTETRSLQSRSYAADGARYLHADLMLLTHAGVLSGALAGAWYLKPPAQKAGNEIRFFDRSVRYRAKRSACSVHGKGKFHSSAPLHCAVTADAGLPLFTRERAGDRWFIWCLCRYLKTAYLYSSTRRVRCS